MVHLICMQTFHTCYLARKKRRIRKTFENLGAADLSIEQFLAKALRTLSVFSAPILPNFSILGSILLQLRVKARSYLLL